MWDLHSDNGSEFINRHMLRLCERRNLLMTRGRPNHKNDNPRVEQKNWTHVRRVVGYRRLETGAELRQLRKVYRVLETLANLFETNARLESKHRDGAKVKRRMGAPRTPLDRLADHHRDRGEPLPERVRELLDLRAKLDPFELHEQLREAVDGLHNLARLVA